MPRRLLRWVPTLIAISLVTVALLPGSRGARARDLGTDAFWNPLCSSILQQQDSAGVYPYSIGEQLFQPVANMGNISGAQLNVTIGQYSTVGGTFTAVPWSIADLAPDPSTVAFRTGLFSMSVYANSTRSFGGFFDRPVVVREYPGVADPLRASIAIRYELRSGLAGHGVVENPDGAPGLPVAMRLQAGALLPEPLPGPHPVLSMTVCGGDDGLQALRVIQGVQTTDADEYTTANNFLQRFRVPATCEVSWFEVAFFAGSGTGSGWGSGRAARLTLYDLASAPNDPPGIPGDTIATALVNGSSGTAWVSHLDFDHQVTLQSGHDYGLYLDSQGAFIPLMRRLTGHEGTPFTSTIGPLHERDSTSAPWREREARTLSFRLIGVPVQALDAPAATPNVVQLRVSPNPSRGAVMLALSGARGAVGYEVLDARGRRVASATSADGRWLWRGVDDAGRPLAAGVYFVRARSASGVTATERVVRVR